MQIIKSFLIAVSMYSVIPVRRFAWKEEDMKYVFCFFPWVGALIGGCIYFWSWLCRIYQIGGLCRAAIAVAIPVFLTGGFHADGFMDTMDAIHSYRSRERKLEILKDSHIGAFAAILLAVYGLVFLGAFSEVKEEALLKIVCAGFFLSRCLCGLSAVSFPLAKKDGMLSAVAGCSHKKIVKGALGLQGMACIGLMCFWSRFAGLVSAAAALLALACYFYRSRKEFGGITGDTSGYFILLCEVCITAAAAFINIFMERGLGT
ncbi:MAG: adenosylcobinamide-GDP ribazoletransferase [Muribaculaceae bacterium]|nr:adenosylcobinamide-GDP ribazoletransferase [Roseburia sp.]MCM1431964.1 adenosylcobinamide-GDP ribazoletransferase [Muribaculaceae bacterium]MCM1493594.1 adenosylcobinamide-GDP ribazoletransferase [Muribaculaceae bacterium]